VLLSTFLDKVFRDLHLLPESPATSFGKDQHMPSYHLDARRNISMTIAYF
jgi:hypothetical protein